MATIERYAPGFTPQEFQSSWIDGELRRISNMLSSLDDARIALAPVATSGDHGDLTGLGDNDHPQYLLATSYTAADVLSKLLTVDGAGSGLDADLLDGISSAAFAQLASANTFTADQLVNTTTNATLTLAVDNDSNGTANAARVSIASGDASFALFAAGSGRTSVVITNGPTGAQGVLRTLGSYPMVFGINNTYQAQLNTTGQFVKVSLNSASTPDYTFDGDEDTGLLRFTTNACGLAANGQERIRVNATGIGFNGAAPIARPDYTVTNPSALRSIDVSATSTNDVRRIVGTLIADLISYGILQ